ncbi:MAG: beta-ketoacyl-[acyl-carrier-protein] synthase family protein [Candidatus Omnitrophica bacterium]|jgi:3-oxoacyl-[acyl-carrier-protein] synthase II|nr:beta-ketoacyl-[acyl-carrier-protein] synthase family protein [Candidatus Omnitrophota bacterium]
MINREVVVTGLGAVTSIGIGKEEFWSNVLKGKSGISDVTLFDTSKFKRHRAGEIKNFNSSDFIPESIAKFIGRASQFAIAATKLALEDANLTLDDIEMQKLAIIIGTTMAESNVMDFSGEMFIKEEWGRITKQLLVNTFSPSITRSIGYFLKAKGENLLIPNACAAGNYAIGYGFDLIRKGEIEFAIVGGAEALSRVAFQGFQRLYAMSPEVCSPFDKNRQGMLLGEGAGILILESLERAVKRNAPIYAKVLEYGLSCDAYNMTIPNRIGIKKAMAKAIKNANISPNEIDYINAHGTGTVQNDKEESNAIKEIFRDEKVAVSSIKSMLGHTMGAASALEALTCCLALKEDIAPPTINFKTPDPQCNIDCVPNQARKIKINKVLNNGFAFGGNNCCVVLGKA